MERRENLMGLDHFFDKNLVFCLEADNQEHLFDQVATLLEEREIVTPTYREALITREKSFPTGLDMEFLGKDLPNVAIPHTDIVHNLAEKVVVVRLEKPVTFVPETRGEKLEAAINALKDGDVLLFENTRFEDLDGKKESKNDPELGKYWASLGDLFVNDAFGTAHRAHASNVGIASQLESAAGFLMEKEIKFIGGAVDNPERPFVAILGGAKVSDKIGVINSLLDKADKVLIGGGMAYTFFKAMGREVGLSLLELDRVELAKEIMEKAGDKLVLPIDNVVAKEFSNDAVATIVDSDSIPADQEGLDIGPKTVELFASYLKDAKTVVWNGPMGVFELPNFAKGTIGVCEAIANLEGATTIIGGGDSAAAAISLGYADKFTHISTGGGASLEYLEGKELPGVAAISDK